MSRPTRFAACLLPLLALPALAAEPLPADAVARVGSTRLRHGEVLGALAYSADGKMLASAGYSGGICLWDAATGELRRRIDVRQSQWVNHLHFSPDGKVIAVCGNEYYGRYDTATGRELRKHSHSDNGLSFVVTSADAKIAALGFREGFVKIIDADSGKQIVRIQLAENRPGVGLLVDAAFRPDGKVVYVTDTMARTITSYDTTSGAALATFKCEQQHPWATYISANGAVLGVLSMRDDAMEFWDLAAGKLLRTGKTEIGRARALAFSPDGKTVAAGGVQTGGVQLMATGTGDVQRYLFVFEPVSKIEFSPDGKTIATGRGDGVIELFSVSKGGRRPHSAEPAMPVTELRFLGRTQLQIMAEDSATWDWSTGRKTVQDYRGLGIGGRLSPDGRTTAMASADWIEINEAGSGARKLTGHTKSVKAIAFTPDGRTLFSTGEDNRLRAWDTEKCSERFSVEVINPGAPVVSADGSTVAVFQRSDGLRARLWDARTGKERPAVPVEATTWDESFALSADGSMLATYERMTAATREERVAVRSTATGRLRVSLQTPGTPTFLAFSPDSRTLAVGGSDGRIHLVEVASGEERYEFNAHRMGIQTLSFSRDGRLLASASSDIPVYVWSMYGNAAAPMTDPTPESEWHNLGGEARPAFFVLRRLISEPAATVALLRERLKPAAKLDAARVEPLLKDLADARFAVREEASAELARFADQVEGRLQRELAASASAEARRRLQALLDRLDKPTADDLRRTRALEALEQIGDNAAKRLLTELAAGEPAARLTREARETLRRLQRR